MVRNQDDQALLRRYLLRQLTDAEQHDIETRLFQDAELYEELELTESELVDAYVAGNINDTDRKGFEDVFLAAQTRHEDLRFAKALRRYVAVHKDELSTASPVPFWNNSRLISRIGALAAVVIIIVGALWFFRPRTQLSFVRLTLTSTTATRSGQDNQIPSVTLPSAAGGLDLTLVLPETPPTHVRYRAELVSAAGTSSPATVISQDGQTVTVRIPATELKRGSYDVKLFVRTADDIERRIPGNYFFQVN